MRRLGRQEVDNKTGSLDIVIPYMGGQAGRGEALAITLAALGSDPRTNIIVSTCEPPWRPSLTRNTGARRNAAPWILFLDADMAIEPGGIEKILAMNRS